MLLALLPERNASLDANPVVPLRCTTGYFFQPSGLPPGAFAAILWMILFYAYRKYFESIFTVNATPS